MRDERLRLETIAETFSSLTGFNGWLTLYGFRTLRPFFRGRSCLELGCADGQMTRHLVGAFDEVVAVDGSRRFIEEVRRSVPGVEVVASLFEEFSPGRAFDTVIMAHVLEHVADPGQVLRRARSWIAPGGRLLAIVPNAESLHRRAGRHMGLLNDFKDLSAADHAIGHRRYYDSRSLRREVEEAGYRVSHLGGNFLKPLSNAQIEAAWTPEMMEAFYALGKEVPPEWCAEIYLVAEPRT